MSTNGSAVPNPEDAKLEALLRASPEYVRSLRQGKSLENATPGATMVPAQQGGNHEHHTRVLDVPDIYRGICQVAKAISREGISKDKKNSQQGYSFRGIDDIYNALSALLAGAEICILPRMLSRSQEERTTAKGSVLFYAVVQADFDFVSCRDGSRHTVTMYGEGMDSADKATNKAMSAAYKYACMQVFCIPTEGMPDADATTPEVIPPRPPGPAPRNLSPRQQERQAKQTAAAEVADRKIDGMQAGKSYEQVSAEERARIDGQPRLMPPKWAMNIKTIKEKFAEISQRMPTDTYHEILAQCGVDSPAQFKGPKPAWECYQVLDGWLEAAANPESFEHFEAAEGGN